jgi:hypothetical protein
MIDQIDELVARSENHRELRAFHEFHTAHPEVLDFLVAEIQLRIEKCFDAFSHRSLWEYARWKVGRAIIILHPEFNGRCEFRASKADEIFGTRIEPMPDKRPKNYARRLQWADGTAIENGWRPSTPHVASHTASLKPDIHTR